MPGFDSGIFADLGEREANILKCSICDHILNKAVTADCGHTFCKGCVRGHIDCEHKTCPVCTTKFTRKRVDNQLSLVIISGFVFRHDYVANGLIRHLKIECKYKRGSNGCQTLVEFGSFLSHIKDCEHRLCPECELISISEPHNCLQLMKKDRDEFVDKCLLLINEFEESKKENLIFEAKINSLTEECDVWKHKCNQLERRENELKSKLSNLTNEVNQLKNEIDQLIYTYNCETEAITNERDQLKTQLNKYKKFKSISEDTYEQNSILDIENERLSDECQVWEQKYNGLREQYAVLDRDFEIINKECEFWQFKYDHLDWKHSEERGKYNQCRLTFDRLLREIHFLTKKIIALRPERYCGHTSYLTKDWKTKSLSANKLIRQSSSKIYSSEKMVKSAKGYRSSRTNSVLKKINASKDRDSIKRSITTPVRDWGPVRKPGLLGRPTRNSRPK